jgi:hypothetical protein
MKRKRFRTIPGHPRPIEVDDDQAKFMPGEDQGRPEAFVVPHANRRDFVQEAKDDAAHRRGLKAKLPKPSDQKK